MQSKFKLPGRKAAARKSRTPYRGKRRTTTKGKKYAAKRPRAGASAVSAPVQMGVRVDGGLQSSFTQKQMSGGGLRITGRSFITSIDTAGKFSNGLLAVADCNPILLNDRVAAIATTYEKYVYQSITYRYVPQCATSTAGSVMLTFERDPANPTANGGDNTTFMQNCMSYEHTSITPPWVGSSVTYKRDANEKKLFYISGQGSNFNPRDTSQGQFLCYGANVPVVAAGAAGGGLGFIVMDYVLDLCEPSIMPARTGAGIAGIGSSTNIPSQWQFSSTNMVTKDGAAGVTTNANSIVPGAFSPASLFAGANSDCIVELILEGQAAALPAGYDSNGNVNLCTSELNAKQAVPIAATFGRGSHLYLTLRRITTLAAATPGSTASTNSVAIITRNLADAIANLSGTTDLGVVTGDYAFGNAIYPKKTLAAVAALGIQGFYRQITMRASDDFQV